LSTRSSNIDFTRSKNFYKIHLTFCKILYLFPHGNTVATAHTAVEKNEDLVEEPDEEWNTAYPTRDIKTYKFPDEFWNIPYPKSDKDKGIPLIWLNPKSIR